MIKSSVSEIIKKEDGKWVLYNQLGTKVLGRFDNELEAKKREGQIMYFKSKGAKESFGFALDPVAGLISLEEGGRVILSEMEIGYYSDEELRKMRATMLEKYSECDAAFRNLGDNRYSSTDGACHMRDLSYYSGVLSRIESEMAYRLLALD